MSRLAEQLLYGLAARRYRQKAAAPDKERTASAEGYWRWQKQTSRKLFALYRGLKATGKEILEIGCGLGGRTAYLAELGPKRIVGIDINDEEILKARELSRLLRPEARRVLNFQAVSEDRDPFPPESFDLIVMVDCMEHVRAPGQILEEARRLLRPGGELYFGTIGWYHHDAAHAADILPVPFLTLFFADQTILNVIRRLLSAEFYRPTRFDSVPPAARWQGITNLGDRPGEHLNKITVAALAKTLGAAGFTQSRLDVIGFSAPRLRPFNFLRRLPVIREAWHSYLVGWARK
jgi:SAM-dependent methyltransferase